MGSVIPKGVPFAQIPHDLIRDPSIDAFAVRVFADLMARSNTKSRAWPSQRTLSKELGMSRSKVQSSIEALVRERWIAVTVEPTETGHQQRHSYTVFGTRPARLFNVQPDRHADRYATQAGMRDDTTGLSQRPEPDREAGRNKNQELQPELQPDAPRRDLLWESFVAIHGEPATAAERGKFNKAVAKLKDADVTADEYPALVQAYTSKNHGNQPAPLTIANERVGELRHYLRTGPVQTTDPDELARRRRFAELEQQHALEGGTR